MLKSTTRHIQIYAAELQNDDFVPSESTLILDVDPDNEFNWNDESLKRIYQEFERLVADYEGADLTDYTLRRIGSELEHFIRSLLQAGEISYNIRSRVMNYSMGLPQVVTDAEA
jgi:NAD(P)H-quinone oxidoreductase subunit M